MGLYDREYSREPDSGFQLSAPQSATMQLLAVTIGVYVAQLLFKGLTDYLELRSDWYLRPWEAYRLLAYGFAHAEHVEHIIGNMLVLGFFGRPVEQRYGRMPFLAFYLTAIVIGGLGWSLAETLDGRHSSLVGASAATTGVFLLFALNYPRAEVRLFFILPVPAWIAALLCVILDLQGAVTRSGPIAFVAHLSGALFAWLYFRYGWSPALGLVNWLGNRPLRSRPKLRVHEPDDEDDEPDDLGRQVDEILAKIKDHGQDSLTRSERKLLEKASRAYQQKRR